MAKIRQLLKHVSIGRAPKVQTCQRNAGHQIAAGDWCVLIRDEGMPYKRVYCRDCALPMFKQCASNLREYRDVLYPKLNATAPSVQQHQ